MVSDVRIVKIFVSNKYSDGYALSVRTARAGITFYETAELNTLFTV